MKNACGAKKKEKSPIILNIRKILNMPCSISANAQKCLDFVVLSEANWPLVARLPMDFKVMMD